MKTRISMIDIVNYASFYLEQKIDDLNEIIEELDPNLRKGYIMERNDYQSELDDVNDVLYDLYKMNY